MENVNVYNNGHGWRISFPFQRAVRVLTVDEAKELRDVLSSAIEYAETASHPTEPGEGEIQDKLHQIKMWIDAYPLKIFPEPDFEKAAKVLKDNGMTLDAISASNTRHVLNGIRDIIENNPTGKGNDPNC